MIDSTKIQSLSTNPLEIALGQTAPKTVGIPEGRVIKPGETIEIPNTFNGGCAKMFIWSLGETNRGAKELLWCGIIPLGGANPLTIDSKERIKVMVDDGELPQCPETKPSGKGSESSNIENFEANEHSKTRPSWWWILLFLTILFGIYLLKYHYVS